MGPCWDLRSKKSTLEKSPLWWRTALGGWPACLVPPWEEPGAGARRWRRGRSHQRTAFQPGHQDQTATAGAARLIGPRPETQSVPASLLAEIQSWPDVIRFGLDISHFHPRREHSQKEERIWSENRSRRRGCHWWQSSFSFSDGLWLRGCNSVDTYMDQGGKSLPCYAMPRVKNSLPCLKKLWGLRSGSFMIFFFSFQGWAGNWSTTQALPSS